MKTNFYASDKKNWSKHLNEANFEIAEYIARGEDFYIKVDKEKTAKQLKGFWRLTGLIVPHWREQWGGHINKELVSECVKVKCGFFEEIAGVKVNKSLTSATVKEMKAFIDFLYELCEGFGISDYKLRSSESRALNEFYKLKI